MQIKITPSILKGKITVPPSKSYSHRAIIAASLAKGESKISNVIMSNDIIATIDGMKKMGAKITDDLVIKGSLVKRKDNVINCNESGSTIRFLLPIALTNNEPITFTGENNLVNRPLDPYIKIFDEQNIVYEKTDKALPLKIFSGLKSGIFNIRGDISSQFITGLLYALPLLKGDSVINITTRLESIGYVDLTIDILNKFGIEIKNEDYKKFIVKGNQTYIPFNYKVEGDYSQAAFWLVAGLLGDKVELLGMNTKSLQGDIQIIEFINLMGGQLLISESLVTSFFSNIKASIIDLSQAPDLGPIITVLAALSEGTTKIINASRLKIKESDRIISITTELNKMGANITPLEDGMIIKGVKRLKGANVSSWNDHRIAMALAIASIRCDGDVIIDGFECISKSYPHFLDDFKKLGGVIHEA